ncbi:MAG: hypothetical protein U0894_08985 [Pirellulales bacterium]
MAVLNPPDGRAVASSRQFASHYPTKRQARFAAGGRAEQFDDAGMVVCDDNARRSAVQTIQQLL